METINEYLLPFIYLLEEMAPYLLLGFLFAGVLHAFVPRTMYGNYLGKNSFSSVLYAILFGVPLPLCSCGVIPTAVGMRKEGASKGATTAFLIATPQTGVDSILATYSVLGWPFAILRPIVAIITGFIGGITTNVVEGNETMENNDNCDQNKESKKETSFLKKCSIAIDYGFTDMLMDIGHWLMIGIIIAGLITIFIPDDFFLSYSNSGIINMFLVLVIACPMYVCATGSIPIAVALMLKGLSPGAALVFLMAGPATNMASMLVLGKTLGKKTLITYMVSIVFGAMVAGFLVDNVLPTALFTSVLDNNFSAACCHEESTSWFETICSVVFIILLVRALYLRYTGKSTCHCHDNEGGDSCGCSCGCHDNDDDCCCHKEEHHHEDSCCCHETKEEPKEEHSCCCCK